MHRHFISGLFSLFLIFSYSCQSNTSSSGNSAKKNKDSTVAGPGSDSSRGSSPGINTSVSTNPVNGPNGIPATAANAATGNQGSVTNQNIQPPANNTSSNNNTVGNGIAPNKGSNIQTSNPNTGRNSGVNNANPNGNTANPNATATPYGNSTPRGGIGNSTSHGGGH